MIDTLSSLTDILRLIGRLATPAALLLPFCCVAAATDPAVRLLAVPPTGEARFSMAATETTWPLYRHVREWSRTHDYDIASVKGVR